mgnify:CR=1 FL=1
MRKIIFISILLITAPVAFANPPSDFISLEVCATVTEGSCTLRELSEGFPNAKTRWEKGNGATWILRVDNHDKMSGTTDRMSFEFKKVTEDGHTFAKPTRMTLVVKDVLGKEHVQENAPELFLNAVAQPIVEKSGKKSSFLTGKRLKEQKSIDIAKENFIKLISGSYVNPRGYDDNDDSGKTISLIISRKERDLFSLQLVCETENKGKQKFIQSDIQLIFKNAPDSFPFMDEFDWRLSAKLPPNICDDGVISVDTNIRDNFKPQVHINGKCCPRGATYQWKSSDINADGFAAQKAESEKKDKEDKLKLESDIKQTLERVSGKYKNRNKSQGGEFSIEMESLDKIILGYKRGACVFHHKELPVQFDKSYKSFDGTLQEGECEIRIHWSYIESRKIYALTSDESGKCEKLCGQIKGDSIGLMGNYEKNEGTKAFGFELPFKVISK